MSETFEMVAKTLYGLEEILAEELLALGANDLQIGRRMVSFTGDKELLYKANFHCRTALRILKPIYHFKAKDADTVYKEVKKVEWEKYLSLDKTFAIDSVIYSEDFNHSKFVAYRTKDAIVDYFIEKFKKRPSVRVNNPDLYINIHISHNDCTLSIDSSGESLHKRGYRVDQTEAPLNEVLAAGMILKTGWKGESNFVDPMCGSGTLLIEAAMIALNIAPGIHRKEFAFQKWVDYDEELFDRIYNDESGEREFAFHCYGSDISQAAIDIALENIRSAGLMKYIDLKVKPFQQYTEAPKPGILVTNPPYGERISSRDLLGLYNMIGERLKHVFMGYKAWILSYKDECFDKIGLRPSEKIKLMNGSLECEYRCYELFEGTNKDFKKALKNHKLVPTMVQVGNEITKGLLWPDGYIEQTENMAHLLKAGIKGVREECPDARIVLHLDFGTDNKMYRQWFDQVSSYALDFDIIGMSYYPHWNGSLSLLLDNMNDISSRYDKDVLVAETSIGYTTETFGCNGIVYSKEHEKITGYPATQQGQEAFLRDLFATVRSVNNKRGIGVFYWEPAWLPIPDCTWASKSGSKYMKDKMTAGNAMANMALFDENGNANSALINMKTM